MKTKGLLLAGGKGTRLLPATNVVNKHMVPILNKPMIMYPLETLKAIGVTDIMIVSGGGHIGDIAEFLGDGSDYGVKLTYRVQKTAGGIGQALTLAKDFVGEDNVAVVLGDNIFGVDHLLNRIGLTEITHDEDEKMFIRFIPPPADCATIVVKKMSGASRFGVLIGDNFIKGDPDHVRIIEKPKDIDEGLVVTGLYIYPNDVFDIASNLKPSARGEIEITDVNNHYLLENKCIIAHLQEQDFWSDAGTRDSLKDVIDWVYENEK